MCKTIETFRADVTPSAYELRLRSLFLPLSHCQHGLDAREQEFSMFCVLMPELKFEFKQETKVAQSLDKGVAHDTSSRNLWHAEQELDGP